MLRLPLSIDRKLFVLQIQLDVRLSRVQFVAAVEGPRIESRIGGRLYIAGLETAVAILPLAIRTVWDERKVKQTRIVIKFN